MELSDLVTRIRREHEQDPDSEPDAGLVSLAPVATVTWFTDPWSVWCYAMEPAILRLRLTFGSQVRVRVVFGGIIERRPPGAFDVRGVTSIFETARRASGMPITTRVLFDDPPESTFPAGIAAAAVALAAPERAEAYLRRLREYACTIGENISRTDVQMHVVEEVGVDAAAFAEAMGSGEAEREFQQDLAAGYGRNIHAYPTVMFERDGAAPVALGGMHHFPVLRETLLRYTEANLREFNLPTIHEVFDVLPRLATREVAELLDVGIEEAFERLQRLEHDRVVRRLSFPGGYLWERN